MTTKTRPDGWVCYHPDKGYLDYQEGNKGFEVNCIHKDRNVAADSAHVRTGSQFIGGRNSKGWQIKPVWLSSERPIDKVKFAHDIAEALTPLKDSPSKMEYENIMRHIEGTVRYIWDQHAPKLDEGKK